jgi:hypothetical protein
LYDIPIVVTAVEQTEADTIVSFDKRYLKNVVIAEIPEMLPHISLDIIMIYREKTTVTKTLQELRFVVSLSPTWNQRTWNLPRTNDN